jgi:hypothetical protein
MLHKPLLATVGLLMCVSLGSAATATSVSQFGITWTFDKAYETGQFVNGDWWVVGPVVIQSVNPAPGSGRNGSMVNPAPGRQAYDSRGGEYDASSGATFPLSLTPTKSLVSSISHPGYTCVQGGIDGNATYDGDCQRGPTMTQAVLTVVPQAPAAGSFRPAYCGSSYKTIHASSSLDWNILHRLFKQASYPASTAILRHVERPWIDHIGNWTLQHTCATYNMYCYGREIASIVSDVSLYVLLNTPEQQELAIRFIQLGIDNYGVVKAGGGWPADGGHMSGRKWPIVFAGLLLNDADLKNVGQDYGPIKFGEDCQTYYRNDDPNDPWWGIRYCYEPDHSPDEGYRICCTSHTWVGFTLAARIMGAVALWNHNALFDYVDRWMEEGGNTSSDFVTSMWNRYRNNLPSAVRPSMRPTEAPAERIAVWDNPALGTITFDLAAFATAVKFSFCLYDNHGTLVKSCGRLPDSRLVVWGKAGRPAGIYFYVLRADGVEYTGKVAGL